MKDRILFEIRNMENLIEEIRLKYEEKDIRISYFEYIHAHLAFYFQNLYFLDDNCFIDAYRKISNIPDLYRDNLQIPTKHLIYSNNSKLLVDCWASFEYVITLIAERFVTIDEKNDILQNDYSCVKKIIKSISEEIDLKLRKKLINKHFTLCSLPEKYNKLYKIIKDKYSQKRNIENDKKFLGFVGRLRNCIHSNYVYFGNEIEDFTFNDIKIAFKNGKLVTFNPIKDDIIIDIVIETVNIFKCIIDSNEDKKLIENPASDLYEPIR